ncbi:beta-galactosidase [Micromonospora sp. KC723]|uniref:beta-galactosidase n=1 Tax=Micromonospora sp. KC723 TaxID=2530381 RepID=UPI001049C997|nr:beta-galactosidase [Micromonospora sp. KC723]TDB78260.1 beta-galactosidase [Micromonospora sp. KC723]
MTTSRWPSIVPGLDEIAFGGDYSPEQWSAEVCEEDIRLMHEAGVNLVQIGIFLWAAIEPAPGEFDFDPLDRMLDRLHRADIRVSVATPTAAPPAWFFRRHPEALPVKRDGRVLGIGARESYCPSSPAYRAACERFVTALAKHYQDHPVIVMWHLNNEYGVQVGPCYCEQSAVSFREWLRERYTTLDGLNAAWGTTFWGQHYYDWDEIQPPRLAPMPVNPSQRNDYFRFTTDEYARCCRLEADIVRSVTPGIPVMTNFADPVETGYLDYWRFAEEVDVVGIDTYLMGNDPRPHIGLAFAGDVSRGVARGRPWLVNEHSTSAVTWQTHNVAKRPGEMRRNTLAHIAHGADGALFFQWRASRFGSEKFHSAMLPQAGTSSQVWRDVVALGADVRALTEVRGSLVQAQAAVLWHWPSWWAMQSGYQPTADHHYEERHRAYYEALWNLHLTTDYLAPTDDLSRYPLVVVPSLYLTSQEAAANLRRYAEGGGTVVVSYFSGIVDENDHIHDGPYPGALRELLGVVTEEFHPLRPGDTVEVAGLGARTDVWSERVVPAGAETIETFGSGPDAGHPAITRNTVGSGSAWYVAAKLDAAALTRVLRRVTAEAGIVPAVPVGADVEAVRRSGPDTDYLFLINHDAERSTTVTATGRDLLTGVEHDSGQVPLEPSGVVVLAQRRA